MTRLTILSVFAVAVLCVQSAQAQYYPGYHINYVPHTTTHIDYVPHGNHYHAVPHTTTHYDVVPHYNNHWGPSIVPHTTTHIDYVPHGNHYHQVPHTTTHYDVVKPGFGHNPHWGHRQAMPKWIKSTEKGAGNCAFVARVATLP